MKARSKVLVSVTLGLGLSTALLLPMAGAGLAGCGGCSAIGMSSLVVTVTDGPGGARICDATVTAHDGTFWSVLMASATGPDCTYWAAFERPGTYTIEVVSGTRSKTVDNIQVTTGGPCDRAIPQSPTIALDP